MRQSEYQIPKCRDRCDIRMRLCSAGLANELEDSIVYNTLHKTTMENETVAKLKVRTKYVQSTFFKLNMLSEQHCLISFRFKKNDIFQLSE